MKRLSVLILSLLCATLCSCQKADPQDLLIGTWEVSYKYTYTYGNVAETIENSFICAFEKGGEGKIIDSSPSTELHDMDDWYFTYIYNKEKNTIDFKSWSGKDNFSWIVDSLTGAYFTCHTSSDMSHATYIGMKMN